MALGYLLILFLTMAAISILIITLLYFSKNEKVKNVAFYTLAIWSIWVAFINVTSLPSNYLFQRFIALAIVFLAIIAVFIKIKIPKKINIAYFLTTASTILGLLYLYLF